MCRLLLNPYREDYPAWDSDIITGFGGHPAIDFHRRLPEYQPTPLIELPALARELGLKSLHVKDESLRFGLKAFKVLGASYAIYKFLKQHWEKNRGEPFDIDEFFNDNTYRHLRGKFTFTTATDGNHGRAVAWTARRFLQKAVIFMPAGTVPARIKNIESEGAEVIIVNGEYDLAVQRASADALKFGRIVISDTAYEGYTEVPKDIMAGYITMFSEMEELLHCPDDAGVDFVFLQGGVGSLAASAVWYYINRYGKKRPWLICVEPTEAACLYESAAADGQLTQSRGNFETMMAGLNCGTPSLAAWPILKTGIDAFVTISDDFAAEAMRRYYRPAGDDQKTISGESGAAGFGALLALLKGEKLKNARDKIGLGSKARVLVLNTEGDTDPDNYQKIIYS